MASSRRLRKSRHGCLSSYLYFLLVANALLAVFMFMAKDGVERNAVDAPDWYVPVMIAILIIDAALVLVLFRLKMWAFWAYIILNIAGACIEYSVEEKAQIFIGLVVGLAFFIGVFFIGKGNRGWSQLD